ncbi:hypothetical protein FF38_08723 [Lucilia cuprina]|uniref:Uncharacterized protein n=1 Tax=Lucilia cuprina TaxID=7375 RepID=A0A0L0CMW8_LUCCU|nr:hypothetical protein FF38_08723 [Lucilia cuprina]
MFQFERKILYLTIFLFYSRTYSCTIYLNWVKCSVDNENFARIDLCEAKRDQNNMSLFQYKLHLLEQPITHSTLQFGLYMKSLKHTFNATWDFCKFQENRNKIRALQKFFSSIIKHTNFNHTCPFNHDIYVKDLNVKNIDRSYTTFPSGTLGQSLARVTQLECEAIDKKFGYFETCGSKLSSNGIKEFNMILRLLQLPVTNCHIQLEVNVLSYIKIPLTFNATYDVCKFMENNSKNRILNRLYKAIGRFLNTNHTCPYNHDLYLSGLKEIPIPLRLPWPKAEYEFITTWLVDNIKRIHCKVIMKKVKCFNTGPTYFHIDKCELSNNLDNSTILKINLRYNHKPVENFETQLGVRKRLKNSSPFLIQNKIDGCKFLKNHHKNRAVVVFFDLLLPFTNLNHSCPYECRGGALN